LLIVRPPLATLFPYTTLFRSMMVFMGSVPLGAPIIGWIGEHAGAREALVASGLMSGGGIALAAFGYWMLAKRGARRAQARAVELDRKSTRLNSSHVKISYAVF